MTNKMLPFVVVAASLMACGGNDSDALPASSGEDTVEANGLSLNGLSLNGLSLNGLSSTEFTSWFSGNPANNDLLMHYMVRCAVPAGETRSYRNPTTGVLYTWQGSLGLTPNWASGTPASLEEQQTISACLAISVLGRDSKDVAVPSAEGLSGFSKGESCLFGNVFTHEGLFVGDDGTSLTADESTRRPCGLKALGVLSDSACQLVKRIGQCEEFCTVAPNGTDYEQCTYNGVQYTPLSTRMFSASSP